MNDPFTSDRHFQIWTYTVSKRRLLLRSTGEGGLPSRIDVCFGGVVRMLLRPDYDGLTIDSATATDVERYRERYGELDDEHTLFVVEPDLAGFVVAGVMQWHEDDGGFQDPSYFGHFLGA